MYFLFHKGEQSDRRLIACLESEDSASYFARIWSKLWVSPIDIVHNPAGGAAVLISRYTGGRPCASVFAPRFAR